jgi:hypothetical protein
MRTTVARIAASGLRIPKWLVPATALLLLLMQASFFYPGSYIIDSDDQLAQAQTGQFNDWHPALMAMFWRLLIQLTGTPASMFLLQWACYWLGFALIADALVRTGRVKTGLAVLAMALFPYLQFFNRIMTKDAQLSAALLMAFGLVFWFRVQQQRVPGPALAAAGGFMAYAVLVRANGAFAVAPLLLYCVAGQLKFNYKKTLLACALITGGGLLTSLVVQKYVIQAKPTQPIRSLQLFDLVGIAKNSRDMRFLAPLGPITQANVDHCYTAYWWDSLAPWAGCNKVFSARLMNAEFHAIPSDRDIYPVSSELSGLWLHAIAAHPLAYLEHRLKLFNSAINFMVPPVARRFGKYYIVVESKDIREDYLRKSFVTWPVLWLGSAALVLTALRRKNDGAAADAAKLLAASSLIYGSAYLVIGVASEARYMYWSILASMLALALSAGAIRLRLKERDGASVAALGAVGLILILGFAARLGDWTFIMS